MKMSKIEHATIRERHLNGGSTDPDELVAPRAELRGLVCTQLCLLRHSWCG